MFKLELIGQLKNSVIHVISLSVKIFLSSAKKSLSFIVLSPDFLKFLVFEVKFLLQGIELVFSVEIVLLDLLLFFLQSFFFQRFLFKSFLGGLSSIYKENLISAIPNDLPIFIFAGENDPVGNFGKGPSALGERLKSSGLLKINTKIYENARHECINELNNDEVLENVIEFCGS